MANVDPWTGEVLAGQSVPGSGWEVSEPEEAVRRSVFIHVKRSLQLPILATHDVEHEFRFGLDLLLRGLEQEGLA